MRFQSFFLFILSIGFFTSCDNLVQEVDSDLVPQIGEKVVVHCYISPQDSLLIALVSLSRPVLGADPPYSYGTKPVVPGALVTLTDGERSVVLSFDEQAQRYSALAKSFPIQTGKNYRLQVNLNNQQVTSSCTVPAQVPLSAVRVDSVEQLVGPNSKRWQYQIRMDWQDPAGTRNFYRTAGTYAYKILESITPSRLEETLLNGPIQFNRSEAFITDLKQDGQLLTSPKGDFAIQTAGGRFPIRPLQIMASLLHTDANYYNYHLAIERREDTSGNPFAEPVLIPSNIDGGLGCFGAYNRSQKTVLIP
ncbi:DUF4249 domain-containing protein [Tellurirhabdus bombi]|uniref:DUF4249 domain-containing protein n=1 Tax=Tellurirhabdus bombi TaxID=2907205 RepID=UPI001F1FD31B|nr:DUF4249 domain-containing protein [Tellurirhabdus bombi]